MSKPKNTSIIFIALRQCRTLHIYLFILKEIFYLTTHPTHFIYRYMASDIYFECKVKQLNGSTRKDRSDDLLHHEQSKPT